MSYVSFYEYYPEVAIRETRTITVFDSSEHNLPKGSYSFIEMFCDDPGCDCRRAFFSVTSPKVNKVLAVIAWGWETRKFYKKWYGFKAPKYFIGTKSQ